MKLSGNLKGKIAIVTGSSRGIGRAIAERLGEAGANVAVNYSSQESKAAEVVAHIEKNDSRSVAIQADISKPGDIKKLFDETERYFGSVDILVNNAGVVLYKPIADVTEEEFDKVFDINVKGTFFACQEAVKRLRNGGRIINFSTTVTALMFPTYGAYAASKGAVEQITRILSKELGPRKITVNVVSPGPTDTELFRIGKSEEQIQRLVQAASLGRLGTPRDIAEVVAFLASNEASWITGQNIRANGGLA